MKILLLRMLDILFYYPIMPPISEFGTGPPLIPERPCIVGAPSLDLSPVYILHRAKQLQHSTLQSLIRHCSTKSITSSRQPNTILLQLPLIQHSEHRRRQPSTSVRSTATKIQAPAGLDAGASTFKMMRRQLPPRKLRLPQQAVGGRRAARRAGPGTSARKPALDAARAEGVACGRRPA